MEGLGVKVVVIVVKVVVVVVKVVEVVSGGSGAGVGGIPVQDAVDAKCTDLDIASRVNENFLICNT